MNKTVAIIGASADRAKYGNKSIRAHRDDGWIVYPVNPKETEVEGIACYASLDDVPRPIHRVSLYVPPKVAATLLDAIAAAAPEEVYFNPGSEDDATLAAARAKGINVIQACSIVAVGKRPSEYTG